MRSRHFELLITCNNDSAEYSRIITSVTKQLKNYQVISNKTKLFLICLSFRASQMSCYLFQVVCKLKQSIQNFTEEIDKISDQIFGCVFNLHDIQFNN